MAHSLLRLLEDEDNALDSEMRADLWGFLRDKCTEDLMHRPHWEVLCGKLKTERGFRFVLDSFKADLTTMVKFLNQHRVSLVDLANFIDGHSDASPGLADRLRNAAAVPSLPLPPRRIEEPRRVAPAPVLQPAVIHQTTTPRAQRPPPPPQQQQQQQQFVTAAQDGPKSIRRLLDTASNALPDRVRATVWAFLRSNDVAGNFPRPFWQSLLVDAHRDKQYNFPLLSSVSYGEFGSNPPLLVEHLHDHGYTLDGLHSFIKRANRHDIADALQPYI